MNIKVVLFDAVGVLFPANTAVGDHLAKRFNLSAASLDKMWRGFYQEYTAGKLTTDEFLTRFAETYGIPREEVTREVFTESFLKELTPMPGMEGVLKTLKAEDRTIAMLSDTTEMFVQARREWLFSEYFDHIFLSFEIGYKKPDKRAFGVVAEYYGVDPEEVFFIDDNQGNVDAARQFGLNAVVFADAPSLLEDLQRASVVG